MSFWEYKVITSGPHGFASPALLETHLNQLGKDEWEIIHFHTLPNNSLAFTGLARRSTMRDWTLEQAAAAAAKVEAEKLRAEFAAKFKAGTSDGAATVDDKPASALADTLAPADGLRKLRDTEKDNDPEALEDEASGDWDDWEEAEDDLPTFFEAVKPHLRKNQKGVGMSVGIDYLSKRWEQPEADLIGALQECGLTVPEAEDTPPDYFEFEGDLYWLNRNNRGQLFLNTREKPRPVFRIAAAKKLDPADPVAVTLAEEAASQAAAAAPAPRRPEVVAKKPDRNENRPEREGRADRPDRPERAERAERPDRPARVERSEGKPGPDGATPPVANPAADVVAARVSKPEAPAAPLPAGTGLLDKIRPLMRRNRRGPGWSGSTSFLARALKQSEADLTAALAALGLAMPDKPGDKPVFTEIDGHVYWLNKDGRGGVWINGREGRDGPPPRNGQDESRPDEVERIADETSSTQPVAVRPAPIEHPVADTHEEGAPAADLSQFPEAAIPNGVAEPGFTPATAPVAETPLLPLEPQRDELSSEPTSEESASEPAAGDTAGATSDHTGASSASPLAAVRLLLTPNKRGSGFSGELGFLARSLGKSDEALLDVLTGAGLVAPAASEDKPVFVEHAAEILWLNKNARDGSLWLNAKTSRAAARKKSGESAETPKPRSPRRPKKETVAKEPPADSNGAE